MKESLRLESLMFLMALRYLTRVPVTADLPQSDDLMTRSTKYHPAVGACVGAAGALVLWLGETVWSAPVAVLLSVVATLVLTGAFHEQGLARSAEALSEEGGRASVLRSFQSKPFGRVGTMTLGLVMALKVALLIDLSQGLAAVALIAAHGIGRMAAVHVVATTHYAKEEGLRAVVPKTTKDGYRIALATTIALLALVTAAAGLWAAILAFLGSIALGQVWRMRAINRMGGYTRDCLGGVEQLAELGVLLGLSMAQ